MRSTFDGDTDLSKNMELLSWIIDGIKAGDLKADEKLPTEYELSEKFNMTRYSVRKALESLEKEGYLYKIQGSGSYISPQAQSSAKKRREPSDSNIIGLVLTNSNAHIFPDVIRGVSGELAKNVYPLSLHITDNDVLKEREAIENLMALNPLGIIMEPANSLLIPYNKKLYLETSKKMPMLLIHAVPSEELPVLSLNDTMGARKIVRHLLDNGHERIGTILCLDEQTGSARYLGVMEELKENGMSHADDFAIWVKRNRVSDIFRADGCHALERMLSEVTAVFCHDDRVAFALVKYLRDTGRRVPEDISVVGYDDAEFSNMDVRITTVAHPKVEYGINAAKALIKLINDPENFRASDYETEPQLIEGETVADISKR